MALVIDLEDFKGRLLAVFFPERCVLCDEVVAYDDMCCENCEYIPSGNIDCSHFNHKFIGALAGAEYDGKIREALWRIKSKPDKRTLRFFAELMNKEIKSGWRGVDFDLIVPVPISEEKRVERGFNQAEKLAGELSKLISVPVEPDALIRHNDSRIQHTLRKDERRANAAKAYDLAEIRNIKGKTILLVDDVFTTGATISACTDKLIEAGADNVYVVTATAVKLRNEKGKEEADPTFVVEK